MTNDDEYREQSKRIIHQFTGDDVERMRAAYGSRPFRGVQEYEIRNFDPESLWGEQFAATPDTEGEE